MFEESKLADAGQTEMAARIFGEYPTMTPEEWAARFAHIIGCSSFDQYRYGDKTLHDWIQRLHRILRTPGEVERLREKYLSREEIIRIAETESF